MSSVVARPRRRLRSEILPFAVIGILSAALAGIFPRGTFSYGSSSARSAAPAAAAAAAGCAFVTLTAEQEAAALAAARTSWQGGSAASRIRLEMLPAALPETAHPPVLDLSARPPARIAFRASPVFRTLPPSVAAPPPERLEPPGAEKPRLAFPRESLLELR